MMSKFRQRIRIGLMLSLVYLPALAQETQSPHLIGRSWFRIPWVTAPSATTARDGLGPLYNARACSACHLNGGDAGQLPVSGPAPLGLTVQLLPSDPHYGEQLQPRAISGITPEAQIELQFTRLAGHYPDGQAYELRQPRLQFSALAYGELGANTQWSARWAPALHGLGVWQRIPSEQILAYADPGDRNQDGISGRVGYSDDGQLGRFGWRATQASLEAQIANALQQDIGITSRWHPQQSCSAVQTACLAAYSGQGPHTEYEISDELLQALTQFVAQLPPPAPLSAATEQRLQQLGCAACHRTDLVLEGAKPYSDGLLHELGAGLADGSGSEWRTGLLWGLAQRHAWLHDGRARSIEEAILWHAGEAETAKQAFIALPVAQRQALLQGLRGE